MGGFNMTLTSFICFLLISYFVQAMGRNYSTCPKSFSCANLTDLSFPYSLSTQPDCGLMHISGCDAKSFPRIQLVPRGDLYYALGNQFSYTFELGDPKLQAKLRQHKCQAFNKTFSLPVSPSISFKITNIHNFFKCNIPSSNTPNITQKMKDHFAGYRMYNDCKGVNIYYKLPPEDDEDVRAGNLPANCSLIRLPIGSISDHDGLFNMLTAAFLVDWKLSDDCYKCHYDGGQCQTDKTNKFHCTYPNNPHAQGHQENILHAQDAKTTRSNLVLTMGAAQGQTTSRSSCTQGFQCGNLGNLSFPFYKSTELDCGLFKVDCDVRPNPIIELDGLKYQALEKNSVFVLLKDSSLEELLKKNSCKIFEKNVSIPISPSITYRFDPLLTLFRCNRSQKSTYEEVFNSKSFQSYNVCDSFILYYNTSVNYYYDAVFPLPIGCSFIQLPMSRSSEAKSNNSGLFHLLTNEVELGWTVSDECNQCYYTGGRCQTDNTTNKFHCHHTFVQVAGNRKTKVIVTVAVYLSCCTGILILLFCIRKRTFWYKCLMFWESKAEDHRNIEAFLKNNGSYAPKRYNYSEVKEMTTRFKNKLGQGGFGNVYRGSLQNGKHVAVKILHELKGSGEEFINEVASISRTSHVNIVSLVGFCFEGCKRALIYEFMPNGSLEKFIYEERSDRVRQLDWPILYQIALGIARGLEYLHRGCNTRILHFDIKPHNILLDEDFCPKISDFGLAKLCMKKESIVSMLGARGTIGYIAPEIVCRNLGGISHKSDVYSYGMMVLEMVGGRKNVDDGVDRTSEIYFPHWLYRRIEQDEELQLNGIMNEEEKECARKMVMVSLWCIQTDPSNRPSMNKVVEMLEGNLDFLQIPPKPYLYSSSRTEVDSLEVELA